MKGVKLADVLVVPDDEQLERMLTFAASAFAIRDQLPAHVQIVVPRVLIEACPPRPS